MASRETARGSLIVIEGLDRAGKTSQCQRLCSTLQEQGYKAKFVKFPDRSTPTGQMIDNYLRGGRHYDDHSVHLLFSANRWEAKQAMQENLVNGFSVIVDRYSYSGAVYSAAKEHPDLDLEWAWQPETGLLRPDLLIFLSISPEEAARRGGFGEERYETNAMQSKVRQLFDVLLDMNHGHQIQIVDASGTISEVAQKLRVLILDHLASRDPLKAVFKLLPWPELSSPHGTAEF